MSQTKLIPIHEQFYALEQNMTIEEGVVRAFLIIGTQKALLIDCGVTPDDWLQIIRSVTQLPIIVALTHADGDHTCNADQFSSIYLHEEDAHLLLRRYPNIDNRLFFLNDMDQLDLGGTVLDVMHIPGHTHGSLAYLNRTEEYLIPGDSVDYAPVHMYGAQRNFQNYVQSLNRLQQTAGYRCIYSSHATLRLPPEAVSQQLAVCQGIMDGSIAPCMPTAKHLIQIGARLYRKHPCSVYSMPDKK